MNVPLLLEDAIEDESNVFFLKKLRKKTKTYKKATEYTVEPGMLEKRAAEGHVTTYPFSFFSHVSSNIVALSCVDGRVRKFKCINKQDTARFVKALYESFQTHNVLQKQEVTSVGHKKMCEYYNSEKHRKCMKILSPEEIGKLCPYHKCTGCGKAKESTKKICVECMIVSEAKTSVKSFPSKPLKTTTHKTTQPRENLIEAFRKNLQLIDEKLAQHDRCINFGKARNTIKSNCGDCVVVSVPETSIHPQLPKQKRQLTQTEEFYKTLELIKKKYGKLYTEPTNETHSSTQKKSQSYSPRAVQIAADKDDVQTHFQPSAETTQAPTKSINQSQVNTIDHSHRDRHIVDWTKFITSVPSSIITNE